MLGRQDHITRNTIVISVLKEKHRYFQNFNTLGVHAEGPKFNPWHFLLFYLRKLYMLPFHRTVNPRRMSANTTNVKSTQAESSGKDFNVKLWRAPARCRRSQRPRQIKSPIQYKYEGSFIH